MSKSRGFTSRGWQVYGRFCVCSFSFLVSVVSLPKLSVRQEDKLIVCCKLEVFAAAFDKDI